MEFKRCGNDYIIRVDKDEEIVSVIKDFCNKNKIKLGFITGIGAVNHAKIGLFETSTKKYHSTELKGDYEITSLTGNISTMNGEIYLHIHISLGDSSYNVRGGHLNFAKVSATAELYIHKIKGKVEREFSDKIGLNLYKFNTYKRRK